MACALFYIFKCPLSAALSVQMRSWYSAAVLTVLSSCHSGLVPWYASKLYQPQEELKRSELNSSNLECLLFAGHRLGYWAVVLLVQRNINSARGEFSSQVVGGSVLGIKRTSFSSASTTWSRYGTQALEVDAVSLLRGTAIEESRAVSKQLRNLFHHPHSDASPRSSRSCGQCMKSSLKFS